MRQNSKQGKRVGKVLCNMALHFAPLASNFCWGMYYQPKEPEGLKEFAKKTKER